MHTSFISQMETSISDLPPHIITDILLRLPTESIIRSRFVSKTWCSLLSNPDFINFHHSRSPASLLFVCPPSPKLHILNLIELEDAIHGNNLRSNLQVRHPFKPGTCLVGAVSGLVCLFKYYPSEATYICNPATREYIILPQPKYTKEGYQLRSFGFGRSSTTGEYKVVRVFQAEKYPVAGTSHTVSEGEIYTIGNGTWKSIGHVPFILGFGFPPLFMNDNLHWLITNPESPEPVIYRFDVNTEVFQPVLLPPQLTQSNEGKWSLGVFGHCLCLCDNNSNSEIVIWRMKDYGVESSWTKEVVISKTPDQEWLSVGVGCVLRVLKDFEDGTILFSWWGKDLLCYNPDNKILEILDVFPHYFEATVYVSSVLSLKSFELENVQVF